NVPPSREDNRSRCDVGLLGSWSTNLSPIDAGDTLGLNDVSGRAASVTNRASRSADLAQLGRLAHFAATPPIRSFGSLMAGAGAAHASEALRVLWRLPRERGKGEAYR